MSLKKEDTPSVEEVTRELSPGLTREIRTAAERAHNEAEFRTGITRIIERLAEELDLSLSPREEYTLLDSGRMQSIIASS